VRILTLGETRFVGRHIVESARSAGHEVSVFSRGHTPLPWDDIEHLRGDRETGDLEALRGREWDACVDVSAYLPEAARTSAELLAGQVAHYAFISTASVYVVDPAGGMDETTPLLPAAIDEADAVGAELYGARKVACEREVESAFPGRTLIIRPGIVAGPHDPTNRFTWWVERLARAGEMVAPGSPEAPVQLVDGRDLGAFTIAQTERLATGVFNVCGPPSSFGELIEACHTGTASSPDVTWVSERLLLERSVEPFTEMPLWLPDEPANRAFYSMSNAGPARRGSSCGISPIRRATRGSGCAPCAPVSFQSPSRAGSWLANSRRSAKRHCSSSTTPPEESGQPAAQCVRAVTSISIFMRWSASAHTCMVAAGSATAKARRSAGQQGSKSSASGSR
jgi:2'-hydroxyisoflavone reductase